MIKKNNNTFKHGHLRKKNIKYPWQPLGPLLKVKLLLLILVGLHVKSH